MISERARPTYSMAYNFKVRSMLAEAKNCACFPKRMPVAKAVCSLNTFKSCHCLDK